MAGRVLCIELGSALTKVCEMDYGKSNPSVYDSFMFETPDGTIEDGYIKSVDAFKEVFKKELVDRNITTNKVIFAVYSNKIATREATIPAVKNDKILPVIKANASDYFPIDLSGYQLGYTILDRVNTKEEKTIKVSVVAAPMDLLESYLALTDAIGIQLVDIDFAGNSIFQAVKDTSNAIQVNIHMNEYSTLISVIEGGKMLMQRSIAYGVFGTIDAVKGLPDYNTNPEFSTMDAIDVLTNQHMIDSEFSQGSAYAAGMETNVSSGASRIVTEPLRALIGNVTRVIDYYQSKNPDSVIGELKLTGLGSQFQGINELFANEIGIKTRQIIAVPSVSFERVGMGAMLPVMLMPIGANLAPMGLVPEAVAKQKAETKKQGSFVLGLIVMMLCSIGVIGLFAIGNIQLAVLQTSKSALQNEVTSKEYIEDKKQQFEQISALYDQYNDFYDTTSNDNENLKNFILELEEKLPGDILMSSLNATTTGISMKMQVETKEEAADIIRELANFQSIKLSAVGISDITSGVDLGLTNDTQDITIKPYEYASDENQVTFTVECIYYVEEETSEEATTAAATTEPTTEVAQ